jgi:spermidine synthase
MGEEGKGKAETAWPPGDWLPDFGSAADLIAYRREQVLASGKTSFQEYEIFESRSWGRVLVLDGRVQSAAADEFIYHEALVHPAMMAHPAPRRVMIMGGGEGATLREVLRHPQVARAVMVDIDEELVKFCKEWLPTFHQGAFDDPRTELVFADARGWLAGQPDASFEVVIIDLPEPVEAGPAVTLFTREMYELVQGKLAPGGMVAVQSGAAGMFGPMMPDLNATLKAVFPRVWAYGAFVPSFMEFYGFHLAGGETAAWPTAAAAMARLAHPAFRTLGWLDAQLLGALPNIPVYLRRRLAAGRVLTDAAPFKPEPGELAFF